MLTYVLRRILYGVLLGVAGTFLTFALLVGTGDPVGRVLSRPGVPMGTAQRVVTDLHLDEPVPTRFSAWVADVLQGDLGRSATTRDSVTDTLTTALPRTAALVALAAIATIAFALVLGTLAAGHGDRFPGVVLVAALVTGVCVPVCGWALLIAGNTPAGVAALLLAAAALTVSGAAALAILQRHDAAEILTSPATLAARVQGFSQVRVLWRQAAPASVASLLRTAALGAGLLVGAVVVVEPVAGVEGLGAALRTAVATADVPVIIGCVLVLLWLTIALEVALAICAGVFDPRIRAGGAA
ncbi:MAG: ABC transporter permease [Acidimicrobiia bacterium]|nr:ABC transporter permease [Acidimicrobiia bacterium]